MYLDSTKSPIVPKTLTMMPINSQFEFVNEVSAGVINFNTTTTGASGGAPFGGSGMSGNLRPAGFYAADYCAWPVASVVNNNF